MIGIEQMFTVVNGQISKNDIAIWSHCFYTVNEEMCIVCYPLLTTLETHFDT